MLYLPKQGDGFDFRGNAGFRGGGDDDTRRGGQLVASGAAVFQQAHKMFLFGESNAVQIFYQKAGFAGGGGGVQRGLPGGRRMQLTLVYIGR